MVGGRPGNISLPSCPFLYTCRYTVKVVGDELRLILCVAIVINLPKFFDSEVVVAADPCNVGNILVTREGNILGIKPLLNQQSAVLHICNPCAGSWCPWLVGRLCCPEEQIKVGCTSCHHR